MMRLHNANDLANSLSKTFGLLFEAHFNGATSDSSIVITPSGIPPSYGFSVTVNQTWKRFSIDFLPGTYARLLVSGMEAADLDKKHAFSALVKEIRYKGGILLFQVNGKDIEVDRVEDWPRNWISLTLTLKTKPLENLGEGRDEDFSEMSQWAELFVACVLALVPLEDVDDLNFDQPALPEGALTKVTVNRYERNRVNRAICLHFHGTKCSVCQMDFEERYGEVGRDFIHVHHIIPVSKMDKKYCFDPVKDLVPVCPNCHAMLHRREPPYSISEMISILKSGKV
jgi:5-methylcytosine-specific restriction protein A